LQPLTVCGFGTIFIESIGMQFNEGFIDSLYYNVLDMTPEWVEHPQTIVFHHGVGANTEIWAEWLPVLGLNYRIARFDMRGFGQSTAKPAGDLSFDILKKDISLIADTLGVQRFHLVGESIGGTAALAYALQHPERLHSLTLTNTAFRGGVIQNVVEWDTLLKEQGGAAWSKRLMPRRFHDDAKMSPAKRAWYEKQQGDHPIESIIVARDILVGADLGLRLHEVDLPVLLLHADGSPFIAVDQMAEMHGKLPQSEFHVFNHARHGLPFSHAKECAQVMLEFLERQSF
jgi:pimeloyl-ACP methyl ester carboxylesterase